MLIKEVSIIMRSLVLYLFYMCSKPCVKYSSPVVCTMSSCAWNLPLFAHCLSAGEYKDSQEWFMTREVQDVRVVSVGMGGKLVHMPVESFFVERCLL